MKEIGPGIHHWKARHPNIGNEVSSYYVEPAATLVDPLEPVGCTSSTTAEFGP